MTDLDWLYAAIEGRTEKLYPNCLTFTKTMDSCADEIAAVLKAAIRLSAKVNK